MKYGLLLLIACFQIAYAGTYPIQLGKSMVFIKQYKHGRGKSFVHLHQNETTALKAAKAVVRTKGGTLLTLVHPGTRNISFTLRGQYYEFDPNRIYTDVGIKKTLQEFSHYSPAAKIEVKKLANKIISLLPKGKVVAVHNNKTSYSLKDYLPGNLLAKDVRAMSMRQKRYYRNFYLVTKKQDYYRLKRLKKYNIVWQARSVTDDGSLSVCLRHRKYINVEAGYDQLAQQIKMLKHA